MGLREMDSAKFSKLARDCGFIDRRVTPADVDLIFTMSKTKGLRRLQFEQFVEAVHKLGTKLYRRVLLFEVVHALVVSCQPGLPCVPLNVCWQ